MVDRFLVWLSVSVVTAGMSMSVLAGAAVAAAEDGTSSGAGGATSESRSESADADQDSTPADPGPSTEPGGGAAADDADTVGGEPAEEEPAEEELAEEEPSGEEEPVDEVPAEDEATDEEDGSDLEADEDRSPAAPSVDTEPKSTTVVERQADPEVVTPVGDDDAPVVAPVVAGPETIEVDVPAAVVQTPEIAAVTFAAAASPSATAVATASPLTALLDVIGTVVFNLYSLATRLVGGPPVLPPGSTVTVRSSTLRIDCGCADGQGFDVPADWYIPKTVEGQPPPQRLIYLQHGFLAQGPWYSHTAAALAEQTNSIVVAPSITSNFLDADACWLGAAPMHEALAKLFDSDNTALAQSAAAAGYTGAIPTRVVLMGHSLGGGAVSGMARHMSVNGDAGRLAGVVLLDGVGLNGKMAEDLKLVPAPIPVYQLAAPKYFWNQFGVGTAALLEARPNQFIGVTLVGGAHVDAMRGGNPLIQFSQQLVSGFSTGPNVAAARQIMVGWVKDMFAGTKTSGIYADDLDEPISTPAGDATAVALPNSLTKPFLFNLLQPFVSLGNGIFTFEPACVAAATGRATCQEPIAA